MDSQGHTLRPTRRQKLEEDVEVKGMALEVDREALQLELVRTADHGFHAGNEVRSVRLLLDF